MCKYHKWVILFYMQTEFLIHLEFDASDLKSYLRSTDALWVDVVVRRLVSAGMEERTDRKGMTCFLLISHDFGSQQVC